METELFHMPDDVILGLPTEMSVSLSVFAPQTTDILSQRIRHGSPTDKRWFVNIRAAEMNEDHVLDFEAFVDQVSGQTGAFTFWIPMRQIPQGKATGFGGKIPKTETFADGTVYADGTSIVTNDFSGYINSPAMRGSDEVLITNLVPNTEQVLMRGDYFSILHGNRQIPTLYRCYKDAVSNNNGDAVVSIAPRLRFGVKPGDRVVFFRPRGVFQFVEQPLVEIESPVLGEVRLDLFEAFEVLYEDEVL